MLAGGYTYLNTVPNSISNQLSSISDTESTEYNNLNNRRSTLIQQRNSKYTERNRLNRAITTKIGEIAASDKELGRLLVAKGEENAKEALRLKNEIDSINVLINNINVRHNDWSEDTIKVKGSYRDKLDIKYKGFQAKMHAFNELKSEESATWWNACFIMLLFITIETAPTFFKMMTASGPYDDMLRAEMYKVKILADKRISDLNDEINTAVQISTENNKQKLANDLAANKQTLECLSAAQSEVLCRAIELWKEEEMKKVEEDPSAYITVTT